MKNNLFLRLTGILILVSAVSATTYAQDYEDLVRKYFQHITVEKPSVTDTPQRYRMTAVYVNRDIAGNFTGKTKITGDYTFGLGKGYVSWTNVCIANSNNFITEFPDGEKQEYMEGFTYVPSQEMLDENAFTGFPADEKGVFAKSLVWDMYVIEQFAWDHTDALKLNTIYSPEISKETDMAGIGSYDHTSIQLCWTGISYINNEMSAVIEYRAIDNRLEMNLEQMKSKGTEQYWGTVWISLETGLLEYAEMYSGTVQEIEITGSDNPFIVKTIRELTVERMK